MSQTIRQLALPLETHRNHFLFSDYYLNEVLPRQAVWRRIEAQQFSGLVMTRLQEPSIRSETEVGL